MHLYLVEHAPRSACRGATKPLSTVASANPLSDHQVAKHALTWHSEAPERHRSAVLGYPEVDRDPHIAVKQTIDLYTDCMLCHLCGTRTRMAHIRGSPNAKVVAIGEGPGQTENRDGIPFVGKAGRLQAKMFEMAGIHPDGDIAWINLVACRPTDTRFTPDRPPSPVERIACSEHLVMLLRAIRPRVVLCLGKHSTAIFWDEVPAPNAWHRFEPEGHPEDWVAVCMVRHPSYIARAGLKVYKETFAARYTLAKLRAQIPFLTKVNRWRFMPKYADPSEVLVGGNRPIAR